MLQVIEEGVKASIRKSSSCRTMNLRVSLGTENHAEYRAQHVFDVAMIEYIRMKMLSTVAFGEVQVLFSNCVLFTSKPC